MDGDLIESYLDLPRAKMEEVASGLQVSLALCCFSENLVGCKVGIFLETKSICHGSITTVR